MKRQLLFTLLIVSSLFVSAQVTRDQLLAEYLFTGGTLDDTSGKDAHLSLQNELADNTVGYQAGIDDSPNSALVNNGNGLVSPQITNAGFNRKHRRTAISLWVKTGAISGTKNLITVNGLNNSYMLIGISSTDVFAETNDGIYTSRIKASKPIYDDTWHHIMVSRSYGKFYLYVDGVNVASGVAYNFDFSKISISTDAKFYGGLDNIRVYNRGFNDAGVVDFYNEDIKHKRIYVNVNVSGGNQSGDSWANAMSNLQTALKDSEVSEIWVAKGTYYPSKRYRSSTYSLDNNGLKFYGGFAGTENSIYERNIKANPTVLNGDFNNNDTQITTSSDGKISASGWGDNSLHVVTVNAKSTLIDGFVISRGCANDPNSISGQEGSGVTTTSEANSITLKNCTLEKNYSRRGGAVRANYKSEVASVNIDNCIFNNNTGAFGAGIYVFGNTSADIDININNSLFTNNISGNTNGANGGSGSAIWARANGDGSNVTSTITNCTFAYNKDIGTAPGEKGPVAFARGTRGNQAATVNNSIFYHNTKGTSSPASASLSVTYEYNSLYIQSIRVNNSIGEDKFSNISLGNLNNTSNANPLFTSTTDFTLQSGSPAINAGDNAKVPSSVVADLAGNKRIHNSTVDMGAYEYGAPAMYTVSVIKTVNGTVKVDKNSAVAGTQITVTATPASGYKFVKWTGDVSGTTNPLKFTLNKNTTVGAEFISINVAPILGLDNEAVLAAYPNPMTDVVTIKSERNEAVVFYDVTGRKVLTGTTNTLIYVESLEKGIYTVVVNGQSMKLVKR